MRRRDRAVTLIGAKVGKLRAERVAPDDGIAAVARVAEVKCVRHLRYVAADELRISAVTIARQNQRVAANAFAGSVVMNDIDAADMAIRIRQNPVDDAARENDDIVRFSGLAQAIDQFLSGPARQAVHAHCRVAGIVEIVDHIEG